LVDDLPHDVVFKPLLFRHLSKHATLETLVTLAHADGKRIMRGSKVHVYWAKYVEPYGWLVIIGSKSPLMVVETESVGDSGKRS